VCKNMWLLARIWKWYLVVACVGVIEKQFADFDNNEKAAKANTHEFTVGDFMPLTLFRVIF